MSMTDTLRGLAALAAVLALLMALSWLFKKVYGRKVIGGSVAKILGGVSLGTRERLFVVEVGSRWIVVGVAPGRVSALANIEPSPALLDVVKIQSVENEVPASSSSASASRSKFSDLFARLREK